MTEKKPGRPKGQTFDIKTRGSSALTTGDSSRVHRTIATYEMAGRESIHGKWTPRCRVCNHRDLLSINEMLLFTHGHKLIIEMLPEDVRDPDSRWYLTSDMIRHHQRAGHLPTREIAIQTMIDDRMQQLGKSIENFHGVAADHVITGRLMVTRFYEHLAKNPNWVPDTGSVVSVMKMFADAEKSQQQSVDTAAYNQVLAVMIEVIQSVVPDRYEEILHRVSNNPIIAAIAREQQQRQAISP